MTKREVVKLALSQRRPPYVPWHVEFTKEAREKLEQHFGAADLEPLVQNHFVKLGSRTGFFREIGNNCVEDLFGVVWDRTIDKDIGDVKGAVLSKPSLAGYSFPDPLDSRIFSRIPDLIAKFPDRLRVFNVGFSLWERAWTLRGMTNLMMDFYDHPKFVKDLLHMIADYNLAHVSEALKYEIDAVYFGDDWGQQRGLQMGYKLWREFIRPELARMYGLAREAGKFVIIHSCGDVDELFEDLIEIGLSCFNPFQPEVMEVDAIYKQYRGRLAFHGGLSTQRTLPYGSPEEVRAATRHLLDLGKEGGYIFASAHDVEGDVPLENILAFIETAQEQPGYKN